MKPFTEEQLESLRNEYVLAAAELVATKGWPALAVRNVGEKVGKSGNAIHRQFKGSALKRNVIRWAFVEFVFALRVYERDPVPPPFQERELIEQYLLDDPIAAPLMVQVIGLVAARQAEDAEELCRAFNEDREGMYDYLARLSSKLWPGLTERAQERARKDLIDWYFARCVTIVTHGVSADKGVRSCLGDTGSNQPQS